MADDGVGTKAKKNKKARPKSGKAKDDEIPLADLDGGKSKFDLLLQQAVGQTTDGLKKKKKKKGEADSVLESLRKGEGLQKEEDAAIKANTYDPDNSPKNEKSNKRRQKMQEKGKDNTAFEKEKDSLDIIDETKGVKKKKKKPQKDEIIEKSGAPDVTSSKEDNTMTMSELEATPTKKKKKKKPPDAEDERPLSPEEDSTTKGEKKKKKKNVPVEEERSLSPEGEPLSPKSAGKKKKKSELEKSEDEQLLSQSEDVVSPKEEKRKKKKKEEIKSDEERPLSPSEESVTSKGKKKKKKTGEESRPMSPMSEEEQTSDKKKKKKKKSEGDESRPISPMSEEEQTSDKKKKKKKKSEGDESRPISPMSEEEQTSDKKKKKKKKSEGDESRPISPVSEEEQTSDKKKKKKKKKTEEEEEVDPEASEGEEPETKDGDEEETELKAATKKKGKKKKKDEPVDQEAEDERRRKREEIEDEGQILSVTVHRTDKLKNDFHIMHPLVRVHIIDEETGTYLPKQTKDRAVTAYFETKNEQLDKILPIMTQPFDFKEKKSVLPMWEELLLFNENFHYFVQSDPKVIVFFELLDFVSMNTASQRYSSNNSEGGWHRIAWAFLKIIGTNNKVNVGAKVRLQLFVPPYGFHPKKNQVEIYQWWKAQKREPYPSTIYVTLKGITPPDNVEPAMRSMFATQEEVGSKTYSDLKKSITWGEKQREGVKALSSWARLVGQTCRIPNNLQATLTAGRKGCYILKFSHDGRGLACACHDRDQYPILVYEVPSFKVLGKLKGHFGIVYDLGWSKRDTHLLSASSDGTVRVWNMETYQSQKLLPHPAFVYTAQFHTRVDTIVATGGYDQVIRVWDISGPEPHGVLKQEIEDHRGHVNTLIFDDDGQKMYSADSVGNIIIWNVFVTEQPSHPGFMRDWTIYQKVLDPEFKDVAINHLQLHHSGRRLLVHCRDNIIRMVDLRVQRVMQKYIGHVNFREQMKSSISPCGSFIFAGSEDNFAYAWNTETGDQVAMYTELNFRNPVTDVQYHPRDHMMAICSIGDNQPIVIYNYDPKIAQIDAGLSPRHIMTEPKDDTTLSTLGSPKKGEETLGLSSKVLSRDEFQAHATARYEKVMKKLNSATAQMISTPSIDLPGMPTMSPQMAHTGFMSLDQSMTPRAMMATPQSFTPHGKKSFSNIMQQQQFASQSLYLKSTDSDWRPGFSEVGRYGARSSSPTFIGRPPTLSLTQQHGKAQFSYQAPAGKAVPSYKQVVALYDYRAQRSDELTIFKGDVISVLYKDNDNWWMGELPDGQQGFFPANYVAEEVKDTLSDDRPIDDSTDDDIRKSLTAVKTKSGELKFLSGNEDSDEDLLESTRNDKKRKNGRNGSVTGSVDSKGSTGKKHVTINESKA